MLKFKNILSEIRLSGDKSTPTLIINPENTHWVYAEDNEKIEFRYLDYANYLVVRFHSSDLEKYETWLKKHKISYYLNDNHYHPLAFKIEIPRAKEQFNIIKDEDLDEIKLSGDDISSLKLTWAKNVGMEDDQTKMYDLDVDEIGLHSYAKGSSYKDIWETGIINIKEALALKKYLKKHGIPHRMEKFSVWGRIFYIPKEYFNYDSPPDDHTGSPFYEIKLSGDGNTIWDLNKPGVKAEDIKKGDIIKFTFQNGDGIRFYNQQKVLSIDFNKEFNKWFWLTRDIKNDGSLGEEVWWTKKQLENYYDNKYL